MEESVFDEFAYILLESVEILEEGFGGLGGEEGMEEMEFF
jgi:hypothetical protein